MIHMRPAPCCCSTSTTSSASTTPSVTPVEIFYWSRSPIACASSLVQLTPSLDSAATSSPLMPHADRGDALAFADRCAAALSQPWSDRGATINPKVSIGVALAQGDGAAGETLLRRADTAVYECKRTGGDRVVYDVTLECLNVERLRLLTDEADTGALRNRIGDRLGSGVRPGELVEEPE